MDAKVLWETRKAMVDEFVEELVQKHYPVSSLDRAMLRYFWTYIFVK